MELLIMWLWAGLTAFGILKFHVFQYHSFKHRVLVFFACLIAWPLIGFFALIAREH